jgi:putative aldouronate transport system permease protein
VQTDSDRLQAMDISNRRGRSALSVSYELAEQRKQTGLKTKLRRPVVKKINRHWQLYLLIAAPVLYLLTFRYVPMFGAQIAFREYNPIQGIMGSPWVGMQYFKDFFESPNFWPLIKNTLTLSFYTFFIGFPAPIVLALALNEIKTGFFKRFVQMVTYAPYFISTVVMVSMIILFLSPRIGFVDHLITGLGLESINFIGEPKLFSSLYAWSDVWQHMGYGAIIYIAALAGINPQLYEAARVDGASRFQKICHIDLPGLMPAMTVLLVLNVGQIMNVGFEKVFLMQNPLNVTNSEIISTYVYKIGLVSADFSYSAAIGLFNSVINLLLLVTANYMVRRLTGSGLF